MAEGIATGEHFVQIGFTALRDPATGAFLPSVPLYVKVGDDQIDPRTGLANCEKELCIDIASVLAEKFGQYVRSSRKGARKCGNT